MSRWQRHGKTIQWLMRSHVSTLNVSWPVLHICWLCHITAGFYGKCNINDKGAANEREKIRQPTCLSANLRLTKTLAPLARNYKIRLSCSSPPTSKFLIVFCGKNVLTSIHGQISPELSKEDSTVKEIYTKTIISTIKNRKRERNTKEICWWYKSDLSRQTNPFLLWIGLGRLNRRNRQKIWISINLNWILYLLILKLISQLISQVQKWALMFLNLIVNFSYKMH